ncbi:MAG: hypothetical protein M0Z54_05395 [Thermaerobacter sp.]|nr:hypothetical protein [Thermaerobacter sp.]
MVRKQLFLRRDQEHWLKKRASCSGKSEGQVLREALDAYAQHTRSQRSEWESFLDTLAKMPADGGQRNWTRDQLHERSDG